MELSHISLRLIKKFQDLLKENKIDEFFDAIEHWERECTPELFKYMYENIPDFLTYITIFPWNCLNTIRTSYEYDIIKAPSNIDSVVSRAFSYAQVGTLDLSESSITTLSESCFNRSSFDELILPNKLSLIDYNCFSYCYTKKPIIIPSSVRYICEDAFLYGFSNRSTVVDIMCKEQDTNIVNMLQKCKEWCPAINIIVV